MWGCAGRQLLGRWGLQDLWDVQRLLDIMSAPRLYTGALHPVTDFSADRSSPSFLILLSPFISVMGMPTVGLGSRPPGTRSCFSLGLSVPSSRLEDLMEVVRGRPPGSFLWGLRAISPPAAVLPSVHLALSICRLVTSLLTKACLGLYSVQAPLRMPWCTRSLPLLHSTALRDSGRRAKDLPRATQPCK